MRRLSGMLAGLALLASCGTGQAVTATFTSDHCTNGCGPQSPGFATITGIDLGGGVIDITINMLNGNTFANGGQDVVFGFNLVGNPQITYSALPSAFSIPGVIPTNKQNAGVLAADGLGNFEYGIEGTFNGSNGPSSVHFTITGTGLTLASFAEKSVIPPGDTPSFFALDIFSGTNGNTGFVDCCVGVPTPFDVPGETPLPGAIWLFGTVLAGGELLRRLKKKEATCVS